jgi:hypothetical protein
MSAIEELARKTAEETWRRVLNDDSYTAVPSASETKLAAQAGLDIAEELKAAEERLPVLERFLQQVVAALFYGVVGEGPADARERIEMEDMGERVFRALQIKGLGKVSEYGWAGTAGELRELVDELNTLRPAEEEKVS